MKIKLLYIGAIFLISIILIIGLIKGGYTVQPTQIFDAFSRYDHSSPVHFAIVHFRLPRLIIAFIGGAVLSLCGYLFQIITQNALADPYVLGTASGASLGANVAILSGLTVAFYQFSMVSVFAFVGAIVVTGVVFGLAQRRKSVNNTIMILAGIAISALISSATSLLIYYSNSSEKVRSLIFWAMGSFDKINWSDVVFLGLSLLFVMLLLRVLHKEISILMLGEEMATTLGAKVKTIKLIVIFSMCLLVAYLVSRCGPIGFVGLVVPHIVRAWKIRSVKQQLWLTIIVGGIFMMSCEVVSKLLYPPVGLPIGIITSILGVPYFIYILIEKNYKF